MKTTPSSDSTTPLMEDTFVDEIKKIANHYDSETQKDHVMQKVNSLTQAVADHSEFILSHCSSEYMQWSGRMRQDTEKLLDKVWSTLNDNTYSRRVIASTIQYLTESGDKTYVQPLDEFWCRTGGTTVFEEAVLEYRNVETRLNKNLTLHEKTSVYPLAEWDDIRYHNAKFVIDARGSKPLGLNDLTFAIDLKAVTKATEYLKAAEKRIMDNRKKPVDPQTTSLPYAVQDAALRHRAIIDSINEELIDVEKQSITNSVKWHNFSGQHLDDCRSTVDLISSGNYSEGIVTVRVLDINSRTKALEKAKTRIIAERVKPSAPLQHEELLKEIIDEINAYRELVKTLEARLPSGEITVVDLREVDWRSVNRQNLQKLEDIMQDVNHGVHMTNETWRAENSPAYERQDVTIIETTRKYLDKIKNMHAVLKMKISDYDNRQASYVKIFATVTDEYNKTLSNLKSTLTGEEKAELSKPATWEYVVNADMDLVSKITNGLKHNSMTHLDLSTTVHKLEVKISRMKETQERIVKARQAPDNSKNMQDLSKKITEALVQHNTAILNVDAIIPPNGIITVNYPNEIPWSKIKKDHQELNSFEKERVETIKMVARDSVNQSKVTVYVKFLEDVLQAIKNSIYLLQQILERYKKSRHELFQEYGLMIAKTSKYEMVKPFSADQKKALTQEFEMLAKLIENGAGQQRVTEMIKAQCDKIDALGLDQEKLAAIVAEKKPETLKRVVATEVYLKVQLDDDWILSVKRSEADPSTYRLIFTGGEATNQRIIQDKRSIQQVKDAVRLQVEAYRAKKVGFTIMIFSRDENDKRTSHDSFRNLFVESSSQNALTEPQYAPLLDAFLLYLD